MTVGEGCAQNHPQEPQNGAQGRESPSSEEMGFRGRIGGYARAVALTPEEQAEAGRRAVNARWDRERARREAEGLPPLRTTRNVLTEEEYKYWSAVIDERFPDRVYANRMQRRRLAERLAREEAARVVGAAFRSGRAEEQS